MGKIIHCVDPVYNENSKILILGTIPSPKSREYGFFYGHPQNRFWTVLYNLLRKDLSADEIKKMTIEDKKQLLLENKIALWDVLKSCDINGADDNSIKNPVSNDLNMIINKTSIDKIFTTGGTAFKFYNELCVKETGIEAIKLLSTSPANCRYSMSDLLQNYDIILKYVKY